MDFVQVFRCQPSGGVSLEVVFDLQLRRRRLDICFLSLRPRAYYGQWRFLSVGLTQPVMYSFLCFPLLIVPVRSILYRLPTTNRVNILGDIHIVQKAVQNSNVSNNRTVAEHNNICSLWSNIGIKHFLNDFDFLLVNILQVYIHRLRHGHYSKKINYCRYTFFSAWRVITPTNIMEGCSDPWKPCSSTSRDLNLLLYRQLQT